MKFVFSDLEIDREYNISVVPNNPAGDGKAEFLKAIILRRSSERFISRTLIFMKKPVDGNKNLLT